MKVIENNSNEIDVTFVDNSFIIAIQFKGELFFVTFSKGHGYALISLSNITNFRPVSLYFPTIYELILYYLKKKCEVFAFKTQEDFINWLSVRYN